MKRLQILIGKIIVKLLKLMHRNAGNLPGIVLWHLSGHKAVSMFDVKCPIIAITGTNGKTSVTTCIAQLLRRAGKSL